MHSNLVILIVSTAVSVAQAGGFVDFSALAANTMLTSGLNVPYKLLGVVRRCRKAKNQNPDSCGFADGCSWDHEHQRCRADGTLGLRKYFTDRNYKCARLEADQCKSVDACKWVERDGMCKARVMNALRRTRHSDKKLDAYVTEIHAKEDLDWEELQREQIEYDKSSRQIPVADASYPGTQDEVPADEQANDDYTNVPYDATFRDVDPSDDMDRPTSGRRSAKSVDNLMPPYSDDSADADADTNEMSGEDMTAPVGATVPATERATRLRVVHDSRGRFSVKHEPMMDEEELDATYDGDNENDNEGGEEDDAEDMTAPTTTPDATPDDSEYSDFAFDKPHSAQRLRVMHDGRGRFAVKQHEQQHEQQQHQQQQQYEPSTEDSVVDTGSAAAYDDALPAAHEKRTWYGTNF